MAPISPQLTAASAAPCGKNHTYMLATRTIACLSCSFLLQLFIVTADVRAFCSQNSTCTYFSPENEMLPAIDAEGNEAVTDQEEGFGVHETALSPEMTVLDSRGGIEVSRRRRRREHGGRLPASQGVQTVLVVSQEVSGNDFPTVQAAVDAIPMWTSTKWIVEIKRGIYYGTVVVPRGKNYVTFIGEDPAVTTLSCQRNASESTMGIQGCPCVIVEASYFVAKNIAFENTSPKPDLEDRGSQAPAIRISADNSSFFGCFFLGWQDTLYAEHGRQYYENCRIEGNVDFILGYARAVFNNCTIYSRSRGFITAQSRWCDSGCPAALSAFVFLNCSLEGFGPTYLGRPWREYATVVYVDTWMGPHIAPRGWDDWLEGQRPLFSHDNVYFAEINSQGPGGNPGARVSWSHQIPKAEAGANSYENVIAFLDGDSWLPKPLSIGDLRQSEVTSFIPDPFTNRNGSDSRSSEEPKTNCCSD